MKHAITERPDPALGEILVYYTGHDGNPRACIEPAGYYDGQVGLYVGLYGDCVFWTELPIDLKEVTQACKRIS